MRRWTLALWVVAGLLGAAAPAAGAEQRVLATDATLLGASGPWAAAVSRTLPPIVTALHLTTGRKTVIPTPPGCTPAGLGVGQLLYSCSADPPSISRPVLRDLATGSLQEPDGRLPELLAGHPEAIEWEGVGRHWLSAVWHSYHARVHVFVPRSGGVIRGIPFGPSPYDVRLQPDLDRPDLVRTVCAPVRQLASGTDNPAQTVDGFVPVAMDGSWALERPAYPWPDEASETVLQRCGSARREVLCATACGPALLHRGKVVWVRRDRVRVRRVTGGRTTATFGYPGDSIGAVAATGNRLFVQLDGGRPRVVVLRLAP
ncbi:MAG: hypothetical protein JHC95_11170 [Solirubrobacteraceae bacterium]|nr:hypothetical protein [Solirubrobacteraceae bacterium]